MSERDRETPKNRNRVPSATYEVGYGKPPVHSRFTKGRSGNPAGRPKGSSSLAGRLEKMLGEEITIHQNGVPRRIRKGDAILQQLIVKAVRGDLASARIILTQLVEWDRLDHDDEQAEIDMDIYTMSDEELMVIAASGPPPKRFAKIKWGSRGSKSS